MFHPLLSFLMLHTVSGKTNFYPPELYGFPAYYSKLRRQKKKKTIQSYNKTNGGIDVLDGLYFKKNRRWPMVIFYNMVDVSAINAYIIWMSLKADWNASES